MLRVAVPAAVEAAGIDPAARRRHRHRLHRLHDGAGARRRHPAQRGAGFADRPHAYVKLWKHHAAQGQADRINELARDARRDVAAALRRPDLLGVGVRQGAAAVRGRPRGLRPDGPLGRGRRLDRVAALRDVRPQRLHRRLQGHPARTGAYPSAGFLGALSPGFEPSSRDKLEHAIGQLGDRAGGLTAEAAAWTGLPEGIAVAVGNVDAHVTAPAAQAVEPGQMVAIMGTSTCHVMSADVLREVPGMCGVVDGGIVPGSGATRPARAASATSSAGSPSTAFPPTYTEAAAAAGSRARAPHPAGRRPGDRRARPGRPRLALRQPLGARRPRALRPGRRARRWPPAPRTSTARCSRPPPSAPASSSRPSATAACRSRSSSSPAGCRRTPAHADLRRRHPAAAVGHRLRAGPGARLRDPRGRRRRGVRGRGRRRQADGQGPAGHVYVPDEARAAAYDALFERLPRAARPLRP